MTVSAHRRYAEMLLFWQHIYVVHCLVVVVFWRFKQNVNLSLRRWWRSRKNPKIKIQNLLSLTRCFNLDPMRNVTASSCWFCVNLLCSMAMAVQKVHIFVPSYVYVCGRIFSFRLSVYFGPMIQLRCWHYFPLCLSTPAKVLK